MRAQLLAFTILAATFTTNAMAQAPAMTQSMSEKDIMALIDKAKADRKGDAPLVPEPILQLAPYKAHTVKGRRFAAVTRGGCAASKGINLTPRALALT